VGVEAFPPLSFISNLVPSEQLCKIQKFVLRRFEVFESERFDKTMDKLLKILHSEIKAKLEAEKQTNEKPPKKKK